MVPYGDGKNQESSTESINALYGMYLFGLAMNNDNIKNTGALMMEQEIRSTKKYYHITVPVTNPPYPSYYTDKYHIAANMFQTKLDAHTFFGPPPGSAVSIVVHGIQVIPVTPVTEQLWDYNYARDIFDYTPSGLRFTQCFNSGNTSNGVWQWTTINVGVQAIAYPNDALNFFHYYGYNTANYDNGTTPSNVIYWILTRAYGPIGISQIGTEVPRGYSLRQNYPNPFNPTTSINFSIPKKTFVKLVLYDILGREVARLVDKDMVAGSYKYELNANNLSSGVYFYRLDAGDYSNVKKMVLIK